VFYNKLLQVRISEELLAFIQDNSANASRYIRSLVRTEVNKKRGKNDEDADVLPELRAKTPYTFLADLVRVIDGDTVVLEAQLGFYMKAEVRLRLSGVSASSANTAKGKKAIKFLHQRLIKSHLVVESRKRGKYGRYIGYIYYHRIHSKFEDILRYGKVINAELLNNGLATKYKSTKVKK